MQKIVPHLWYDTQAKDAAHFYTTIFPESKVTNHSVLHNTPSGDCDVMSFTLWGQDFMAISAGPHFKFNPSISFIVNYDPLLFNGSDEEARKQIDLAWKKLSDGGEVMMDIGEYPFSKRYGWIKDKYGVTWQLMLTDPQGQPAPPIIPSFMFVNENAGRAEEAINFYLSVFKNSKPGSIFRYGANQQPDKEGSVMFGDFSIEKTMFAAMDSAHEHKFQFNEAVSIMVNCKDQAELNYYYDKLSAVPEAEQCGWIKDKFGVSWQISPEAMEKMMTDKDPKRVARVTQAFLKMKRFNLAELEKAYKGE